MLSPAVLTAFFEREGDAVCVSDSARSIIGWNEAAEKLTGFDAATVVGQDPCDVLNHQAHGRRLCDDGCPSLQAYQQCEDVETPGLHITTRDGRLVAVDLTAIPVQSADGGVEAVIEILRPLRSGAEGLIAGITHELKTPLSAIVGFAGLLGHARYGELTPKQREFLKHIQRSAELMTLMISNAAIGESINQGLDVNLQPMSVAALAEALRDIFEPLATQKKLELVVDVTEGLQVMGDAALLRQVFFNLLHNAVANTPHGSISLRATGLSTSARLEVCDTGVGIPASELSTIMEKFAHVPGHKRGLGYGLFVAKAVVSAHGARLEMHSTPQQGTRVYFELPLALGDVE